ncbi:hypothetical protein L7F22_047432 [Adiantum nelumboides]|nr:hypothetical protein [Adiantum nelumboides]
MNLGTVQRFARKRRGTGERARFLPWSSLPVSPTFHSKEIKIKRKLALAFSSSGYLPARQPTFLLEPHFSSADAVPAFATLPARISSTKRHKAAVHQCSEKRRFFQKAVQRVVCCPAVQSFVQSYIKQVKVEYIQQDRLGRIIPQGKQQQRRDCYHKREVFDGTIWLPTCNYSSFANSFMCRFEGGKFCK